MMYINLAILLSLISVTKAIHNSTECNRSCHGNTVNYPFGFSNDCEFQLDCTSDGRMEFKGFPIRNITWNSISLILPTDCSRPIAQIQPLFGQNFGLTAQNGLLLHNCVTPLNDECLIPASYFESRFTMCEERRQNLSCYRGISSYEEVNATGCQSLFSALVAGNVSGSISWLDFQELQLDWWVNGTCRCDQNAHCTHVGSSGFWCRCNPGYTGDGFIDGEGCRDDAGKICGGDQVHMSNCQTFHSKRRGRLRFVVTLIIAVASLIGVTLSLTYFLVYFKRKPNKVSQGSLLNLKSPFLKISYDMLLKATDRFSKQNLLGAGHFGSVYKGVLDIENNITVAVKVMSLDLKGASKSFMAECEALRNSRHRNLLKIVTACSSTDFQGNDFKALVYEFMPNGNLHQWIHINQHDRILSLVQRLNIAIDVACALDYLHNNCEIPIIHCDLKPANILLDNDMVAHVGDFGLARFHLHAATSGISTSVAVKGTVGYAAPEYGLGSRVSKEGDIYSYGIVLVEMMVAKTPTARMFEEGLDLHKYAKTALLTDRLSRIIDPRLLDDSNNGNQDGNMATNVCKIKCIKSLIKVGVNCSVESPQNRTTIEDVIKELQVTKDTFLEELHKINRYMY